MQTRLPIWVMELAGSGPHLRPEFAKRTDLGRGILTPTTRTSVWKLDAHR
jgi:hypothetical protein